MWLGGGQRGCCSGMSDTVRHSELPEHLCSGQLDSLLGEGLVVWQCGRGCSCKAHGGERGVPARRLGGLRHKWRKLRLQRRRGTGGCGVGGGTGGSNVGGGIGDWDASSGTGSGDACGGCEAVGDLRCMGAVDGLSASGNTIAD